MSEHADKKVEYGIFPPLPGSRPTGLKSSRAAVTGICIVLFWINIAIWAPFLTTHDPITQYPFGITSNGLPLSPSAVFLFGTDSLGRDVFSRVIYGARVSLIISFMATLAAALTGMGIGVLSGYYGGWVDFLFMRLTDTVLAFPLVLLAIAVVSAIGSSLVLLVALIGLGTFPPIARLVRGQVHAVKVQEFVEAARALGASGPWIIVKHIIPNIIAPVAIFAVLGMSGIILLEASLSFLGVGVQPPTPSWGNMIFDGYKYYQAAPWLVLFPGIAIISLAIGFVLLGEGLRDILDPRKGYFYTSLKTREPIKLKGFLT
jgi:ABC-type dipeptide/oligopeptide/nickel transport system permease subunit